MIFIDNAHRKQKMNNTHFANSLFNNYQFGVTDDFGNFITWPDSIGHIDMVFRSLSSFFFDND